MSLKKPVEEVLSELKALDLKSASQTANCLPQSRFLMDLRDTLCELSIEDLDYSIIKNLEYAKKFLEKKYLNDYNLAKILFKCIIDKQLNSCKQIEAATRYLLEISLNDFNELKFEEISGIGKSMPPDQLKIEVQNYLLQKQQEIKTVGYNNFSKSMSELRKLPSLKWSDFAQIKRLVEEFYSNLLGAREQVVNTEKAKPIKTIKSGCNTAIDDAEVLQNSLRDVFTKGFLGSLHRVDEIVQINPKRLSEHFKNTGGQVVTRFPPEPNGHLHIGHSKALMINFGYAKFHDGICYLRFDDTNPEAEDETFVDSIIQSVNWLGYRPYKITYSSDYFDQLYLLAEELIKRGKAYVDHSTDKEMYEQRGGSAHTKRFESKWRHRSVEENLKEFRAMRDGFYNPKEAVLRMKQDILSGNPQMWDLAAYRVMNTPHHRTGDKWKIYPTYDFTHCLVDSLENITHSLCTLEFRLSRESYEWLCNALDVYCPTQREYGRLNVSGTVLSKRKISKLVEYGKVDGWDDPRLFTLNALRRRGVPPGAILAFVCDVGVTVNDGIMQLKRFDTVVRQFLEFSVPRLMLIPDPIKVILENLQDDYYEDIEIPFNLKTTEMGVRKVPFTKFIFIDRSDFREEDSKDFFRLTPDKSVGLLKVKYPIKCIRYSKDSEGNVDVVYAKLQNDEPFIKPKTYIQWVAQSEEKKSPIKINMLRNFSDLFKSDSEDINPESIIVSKNSMIETGYNDVDKNSPWPKNIPGFPIENKSPETTRFQAIRVGYYCRDKDALDNQIILNRILSLRVDSKK